MQVLWDSLMKSLGPSLSQAIWQISGWAVVGLLTLLMFIPTYFTLRLIAFRGQSNTPKTTLREDMLNTLIASPSDIPLDRRAMIQSLASATAFGYRFLKILSYFLSLVLAGGGIYCWRIATPANGLYLIAILLVALGGVVFLKMQEWSRLMKPQFPALNITTNVAVASPEVYSLDTDAIRKAADYIRGGEDLDSVCRVVIPQYVHATPLQQQLFRMVVDKAVKQESSAT